MRTQGGGRRLVMEENIRGLRKYEERVGGLG